jgi:hypothetical protein
MIVGMAVAFSGMMRNFEKGSTEALKKHLSEELREGQRLLEVKSPEDYEKFHGDFCSWGTAHIKQTKRNGGGAASYGQVAKTLNVAMKVIVYYCHYPNREKSEQISKWLHAPIDTAEMALLKKTIKGEAESWPRTLKLVDKSTYDSIQEHVRRFIGEKHHGTITPVQFDDMYWDASNR